MHRKALATNQGAKNGQRARKEGQTTYHNLQVGLRDGCMHERLVLSKLQCMLLTGALRTQPSKSNIHTAGSLVEADKHSFSFTCFCFLQWWGWGGVEGGGGSCCFIFSQLRDCLKAVGRDIIITIPIITTTTIMIA